VSYDEAIQNLPTTKYIGAGEILLVNEDIIVASNQATHILLDTP
jgi:hypothetical protein